LTPGTAACFGLTELNIQINVGRCRPHMWGFMWGDVEQARDKKLPDRHIMTGLAVGTKLFG